MRHGQNTGHRAQEQGGILFSESAYQVLSRACGTLCHVSYQLNHNLSETLENSPYQKSQSAIKESMGTLAVKKLLASIVNLRLFYHKD